MWLESMNVLYVYSKWFHVLCGFCALLIFWIPIVVKKGSRAHVRVGWIYVACMVGVAISAWIMVIWNVGFNPNRNEEIVAFAWFLAFIAILSTVTAYFGIRSLRAHRVKKHYTWIDLVASASLFVSGVAISIFGFTIGNLLLTWFPIVGISLGFQQLRYWLFPPSLSTRATIAHLKGMLSCSISTLTAFTVFGAPRLLGIETQLLLLWLAPTIVLTPIVIYFTRKYTLLGKKFS